MWGEKEQETFNILMKKLCEVPILTLFDGMEDFIVYSDASNKGIGCMLMQRGKSITYASR